MKVSITLVCTFLVLGQAQSTVLSTSPTAIDPAATGEQLPSPAFCTNPSSWSTANPAESEREYSSTLASDQPGHGHALSMLDSDQAWSAGRNAAGEYMIIDLGSPKSVAGVVTQARGHGQYVKTFEIEISDDKSTWQKVGNTFSGATDDGSAKYLAAFPSAVSARYVKFIVNSWNDHISMRAGVMLCKAEALPLLQASPTELGGGNDGNAKNLAACIGECDSDAQCAAGLKCFQRKGLTPVPGCSGSGKNDWDYCYDPMGSVELSGGNDNGAKNLGACVGECDRDSQCATGLKCFQRSYGETIPGCIGAGRGRDWDYCYDPNWASFDPNWASGITLNWTQITQDQQLYCKSQSPPLFDGASEGPDDCKLKCSKREACKFYSIWSTTKRCRLERSSCTQAGPDGGQSISIYKRNDGLETAPTVETVNASHTCGASQIDLGLSASPAKSEQDCAKAVNALGGGYFIVGKGTKNGVCKKVQTASPSCPEGGLQPDDEYDFKRTVGTATCDQFQCPHGYKNRNINCVGDSQATCNLGLCCKELVWTSQPSTNCTSMTGVCKSGTWEAYMTNTTHESCKAICDGYRRLVPEPDGIIERLYSFRQNGQFHNVLGGPVKPDHVRDVDKIDYRGTGRNWNGWNRRDHFYARWEGDLVITQDGSYKFYTRSDDGSRLKIQKADGSWQLVVNNPGWHGMRTRHGSIALSPGTYSLWAEMFEGGGGAGMEVSWEGPQTGNKKVKLSKTSGVPGGFKEMGYYGRQNGRFKDNLEEDIPPKEEVSGWPRHVPNINYASTGGFFDDTFKTADKRDHMYIRWEGYIEIKSAGRYDFYTQSDDGSRLSVDGKIIVTNGGWHGMRERSGRIDQLAAGKHPFWYEMFEGGGGAGAIFRYKGPDTDDAKSVVPESVLSSTLQGSGKLVLPSRKLEGGNGFCAAFSHHVSGACIIYSACKGGSSNSAVCEDEDGFDFLTSFNNEAFTDFTTCKYPAIA